MMSFVDHEAFHRSIELLDLGMELSQPTQGRPRVCNIQVPAMYLSDVMKSRIRREATGARAIRD